MKTILIATDFSEAARNATIYGIRFSRAFHAKVILCNAFEQVPVPVSDFPVYTMPEDMRKVSERQLKQEITDLHPVAALPVEIKSIEGAAAEKLLETATEIKADLVIMGMKTSDHTLRTVFGSTVTSVVKKTKIPVLVVPEEVRYADPKVMALANDADLIANADVHDMNIFRSVVTKFQSKLLIVKVFKHILSEMAEASGGDRGLEETIPTFDVEYDYIKSSNLQDALNDFIRFHRVDILAMLPHKHSLLESWFYKSATRSMIFQTHVPLLILPERSVKK